MAKTSYSLGRSECNRVKPWYDSGSNTTKVTFNMALVSYVDHVVRYASSGQTIVKHCQTMSNMVF